MLKILINKAELLLKTLKLLQEYPKNKKQRKPYKIFLNNL
jgi:hypothetical protein